MPDDILRNPHDPLHKLGPEAEKDLLRAFAKIANTLPRETVVNAALNLVMNVIRQDAETRIKAEKLIDEYFGKTKQALLELHYDNTGKRRNVFPFTQEIRAARF